MSKNELRSSQIITTFGPGAMVDLPDASVIIAGLDHWRFDPNYVPAIDEPRLVEKLKPMIGVPTLTLRAPPPASDKNIGVGHLDSRYADAGRCARALVVGRLSQRCRVHCGPDKSPQQADGNDEAARRRRLIGHELHRARACRG